MKNKVKSIPAEDERRQAEAAKTSRLRALRLAKDAAEKAAAEQAAAEKAAADAGNAGAANSAKPRRRPATTRAAGRSASA
jgi:hypothetical protein